MKHLRAGGSAARGRREDQRVLLFDLKSVQAGSTFYFSTRATDHQAGAVVEREHRVMPVPRQTGLEAEFFAAQVWEAPPDDLW